MSEEAMISTFSDEKFDDKVDLIINAFTPEVRATIQNGVFNAESLSKLPKVTQDWPPPGSKCIYLCLYTHQGAQHLDVETFSTYGGQTALQAVIRDNEHTYHTADPTPHHNKARKSPMEHRYMIPMVVWEAEDGKKVSSLYPRLLHHRVFLNAVAARARELSNWPKLEGDGCNTLSPLFHITDGTPVHFMGTRSLLHGERGITTYRKPVTSARYREGLTIHSGIRKGDGAYQLCPLVIAPHIKRKYDLRAGMTCYLVFEIMHDGQPHAIPWLGCPVIGLFEDFRKASRLGVRMEWLHENQWHSIPFQQERFTRYFHEGISDGDLMKALWPWRKAMDIAQALEGTIYTDNEPLNGFDSQISLGSCDILELQTDYLG
ncbi:unnamed protein product [Clonostachys rhizophaga]|uniref:Uncharacterized protein n=1 Tax=Clonostachys rhizophaga TaxID=160324 RepID=A0A9N9V282_9HYPO|nr:unnamed protein product [Clonostachys rhizophaga]